MFFRPKDSHGIFGQSRGSECRDKSWFLDRFDSSVLCSERADWRVVVAPSVDWENFEICVVAVVAGVAVAGVGVGVGVFSSPQWRLIIAFDTSNPSGVLRVG